MVRIVGYLNPAPRRHCGAKGPTTRILAVTSILTLLVASLAPAWAVAAEPDSEGEGSAPAGLEDPHFEPGGEEAALEVLPGPAESGGIEEEVEGPPIETEPTQEPELPEPAPSTEAAMPPVASEPEAPPPAEAPASASPEYAPAAPEYAAPAPAAAPVENEPIVAPPRSASKSPPKAETPPQPEPAAVAPEGVAEVPPVAVPTDEQEAPRQAPAPVAVAGSGGLSPPLRGRSSYTVRAGDCLWSIAEAALPSGAGNDEIAAEVARLWRLNAGRIGTGDPNLILIGTELRLH